MERNLMQLREKFVCELKENGRSLSYDLSREDHRDVFFSQYGGEEVFKRECPLLYDALWRKSGAGQQERLDGYLVGPRDCMEVSDIAYDPNTVVSTNVTGRYTREMLGVDLMGKFMDITNGQILESMAVFDENITDIENTMKVNAGRLIQSDDRELQTQAEFFCAEVNAQGELCAQSTKVYSNILKVEGTKYIVKAVTVESPKPKDKSHKYTELLYDRDADRGETADYPKYTGVRLALGQDVYVKIHIPAKITIELNDEFEFIVDEADKIKGIYFKDFEMKIWSLDNGTVVFNKDDLAKNIIVTYKEKEKNKITYEFPSDWEHLMKMKIVSAVMLADFSCILPIKCKHGSMKYEEGQVTIVVSSDLDTESEDPANEKVKKIHIKFGCLGKDTRILMADGSERAIEDIRIGDLAQNMDGMPIRVTNIISGMEAEMVYVKTMGNKEILMTEGHPVRVRRDGSICTVRAVDLNGADLFLTKDGEEELRYIYMKPYNDRVYNLEFDGEEFLYANGFSVGDFDMQNHMPREKTTKREYSFDTKPVAEEMRKLLRLYQENME